MNIFRYAIADLQRIGFSKPRKARKARRPSRTKKRSNGLLSILMGLISTLWAIHRRNIQSEVHLLTEEHLTLQEIRKRRSLTQADLAEIMHFTETQISEIEGRCDMYLSTIRRQVEAMGGDLKLVVSFPGEHPVTLALRRETISLHSRRVS